MMTKKVTHYTLSNGVTISAARGQFMILAGSPTLVASVGRDEIRDLLKMAKFKGIRVTMVTRWQDTRYKAYVR